MIHLVTWTAANGRKCMSIHETAGEWFNDVCDGEADDMFGQCRARVADRVGEAILRRAERIAAKYAGAGMP